ncbi:MAG: hypothetical protein ACTSWD_08115 [Candidatus Heimdallarchaeota archaeon]
MTGINDMSSKINKNMNEMNKSSDMLNDNYDDIEESSKNTATHTDKFAEGLKRAGGFMKRLALGALGFAGAFNLIDVVRDTFALSQNMTDLSYRMGEAGKTVGQLTGAVNDATIATGASTDKAMGWVTELRNLRVATSDIGDLTTMGIRFTEVTGGSADATQKLIGNLTTMGGLGSKAIKGIMRDLVGAQRAFGLTGAEVDQINTSIIESTQRLRQMGKSAADVAKFSSGVTKLAGAFSSVGLEAGKAVALIEKLLDPGAIEENAFLFAKLGVSMDDAINGNIDPEKLVGSFQNLGTELKNMSGPAAAQMANALGVPLNQLRQMADMDMDELKGTFADMGLATGDLSAEQDQQATAQKDLTNSMNKFKGLLVEIGSKFMPMINKATGWLADNFDKVIEKVRGVVDWVSSLAKGGGGGLGKIALVVAGIGVAFVIMLKLVRKKFFSVATDIAKDLSGVLTDGMVEGMEMGAEKGSAKAREIQKASVSAYAQDLQQRIIESSEYAATQSAATFYKTMAGTNLTKSAKELNQSTGEWLEKISAGAKPVSIIDTWLKKNNAKQQESIKLARENQVIQGKAMEANKSMHEDRLGELNDRKKLLETAKSQGGLTKDREAELNRINKLQTKENAVVTKMNEKLNNFNAKQTERRRKQIKNLSSLEQTTIMTNLQGEIERAKVNEKRLDVQREENELSIEALRNSQDALKVQAEELQLTLKNGSAAEKADAAMQLQNINTARKESSTLLAQELEQQTSIAEQTEQSQKAIESTKKELNLTLNATESITMAEYEKLELQKQGLLDQREQLALAGKETTAIDEQVKAMQKLQMGQLNSINNEAIYRGPVEKTKLMFEALKNNFVSGMTAGMNKVGDSVSASFNAIREKFKPSNWQKAIATAGDGNFYKGLGKIFTKGAKNMGSTMKSAGKKIGSVMSKAGKGIGGPLMLIVGLFIGALKNMDGFKEILEKVKNIFMGLMEKLMPIIDEVLMPIIDDLIAALMPMVDILFQVLGPILKIIGSLMKVLAPIMIELVKMLLPPMLIVLGSLLQIIGTLISAITGLTEWTIKAFTGKKKEAEALAPVLAMRDLANTFNAAGADMAKTGRDMIEANKLTSFGEFPELVLEELERTADYTGNTADNTNPEQESVTRELYPAIIEATSSGFVKTAEAREVISGTAEAVRDAVAERTATGIELVAEKLDEIAVYTNATATATNDTAEATAATAAASPAIL